MLAIYSLFSHTLDLLPSHLATLRRFLPPARIVIVQGPYGANPFTSAGSVRLTPADAERLGVTLLEAPATAIGLETLGRVTTIADWLWATAVTEQPEQYAMILHGDMIPVRPMTVERLLPGTAFGTRVMRTQGDAPFCPLTWMIADTSKRNSVLPSTLAKNIQYVAGFPSRHAERGDVPGGDYDPALRCEFCDPGWLHIDKMSYGWGMKDIHNRKIALLRNVMDAMGIAVPDYGIGEHLTGLPSDPPRPHGIPAHLLPERALGCAGCGQ